MPRYTELEEKNLALAKRAWSYYEKSAAERTHSDYQPFYDLLADDVVFRVACAPGTPVWGQEFRGKEAVMGMNANSDPVTIEGYMEVTKPLQWFVDGNRVLKLGGERYRVRNRAGEIVTILMDFVHVADFRDGKIVSITAIEDLSEWNAAFR